MQLGRVRKICCSFKQSMLYLVKQLCAKQPCLKSSQGNTHSVESVHSFSHTSRWNDGEIEMTVKIRITSSNGNICKINEGSHTKCPYLRENEPAVEFSHKGFEEQKKVLLADLISKKLQEEVALRKKKREKKPPDLEVSRYLWGMWAFVPLRSELAWRVFQGWGHVSRLTHQTRSPPLCSLYWAWVAKTRMCINTSTQSKL